MNLVAFLWSHEAQLHSIMMERKQVQVVSYLYHMHLADFGQPFIPQEKPQAWKLSKPCAASIQQGGDMTKGKRVGVYSGSYHPAFFLLFTKPTTLSGLLFKLGELDR